MRIKDKSAQKIKKKEEKSKNHTLLPTKKLHYLSTKGRETGLEATVSRRKKSKKKQKKKKSDEFGTKVKKMQKTLNVF